MEQFDFEIEEARLAIQPSSAAMLVRSRGTNALNGPQVPHSLPETIIPWFDPETSPATSASSERSETVRQLERHRAAMCLEGALPQEVDQTLNEMLAKHHEERAQKQELPKAAEKKGLFRRMTNKLCFRQLAKERSISKYSISAPLSSTALSIAQDGQQVYKLVDLATARKLRQNNPTLKVRDAAGLLPRLDFNPSGLQMLSRTPKPSTQNVKPYPTYPEGAGSPPPAPRRPDFPPLRKLVHASNKIPAERFAASAFSFEDDSSSPPSSNRASTDISAVPASPAGYVKQVYVPYQPETPDPANTADARNQARLIYQPYRPSLQTEYSLGVMPTYPEDIPEPLCIGRGL